MFYFDTVLIIVFVSVLLFLAKRAYNQHRGFTSVRRAKQLMGREIFMPHHIEEHFDVPLSREARKALTRVPWSEKTLKACSDGNWVLFATATFSVNEMRAMYLLRRFSDIIWYEGNTFALQEGASVEWHLMRSTAIRGSNNLPLGSQCRLLPNREVLPAARVLVYAMMAFNMKQGDRLFEKKLIRCADMDGNGSCVLIGHDWRHAIEFGLESKNYTAHDLFITSELLPDYRGK